MQEGGESGFGKKVHVLPSLDDSDSEEKIGDQLDRLTSSVQQVLAGARKLHLDDRDLGFPGITASGPPTSRFFKGAQALVLETESDDADYKTPLSEYDVIDDESLEIIEYLASMLEKTQMENEDLRSLILRCEELQSKNLRESEKAWSSAALQRLGLPYEKDVDPMESLLGAVSKALRPEVDCTLQDLSRCEEELYRLLRQEQQHGELQLGSSVFRVTVVPGDIGVLAASKQRLAIGIGEIISDTGDDERTEEITDNSEQYVVECDHDHTTCQQEIEELYIRLQFLQNQVVPVEIYRQVEQEKATLQRLESTRRKEIEALLAERQELENLRSRLKAEAEEVTMIKEELTNEQSVVRELKNKLSAERTAVVEKSKEVEAMRRQVERAKESAVNLASLQGTEALSLKEKIERMVKSHPVVPDDLQSVPESIPDGDLHDLDLRVKQMTTLLSSDSASVEFIQREILDIEEALNRLPQKRTGMRRVKLQLNSAKNRLLTLKSRQAIAGADKIMTNVSSAMQALERGFTKTAPRQSEQLPVPQAGSEKRIYASLTPEPKSYGTPTRSVEVMPVADIADPCNRWVALTETVRSQEALIGRLRAQVGQLLHRVKHTEKREVRQAEREVHLRSVEKQLDFLQDALEKRERQVSQKENNLRRREAAVLAVLEEDDMLKAAKDMLVMADNRVRQDEASLEARQRQLEEVQMEVEGGREAHIAKEKQLAKVQRLLVKGHLRLEKERKKLAAMRQDLTHLLPSLQTLTQSSPN